MSPASTTARAPLVPNFRLVSRQRPAGSSDSMGLDSGGSPVYPLIVGKLRVVASGGRSHDPAVAGPNQFEIFISQKDNQHPNEVAEEDHVPRTLVELERIGEIPGNAAGPERVYSYEEDAGGHMKSNREATR